MEPELDSYTALLAIYGEAGDMESIMKVCGYRNELIFIVRNETLLYDKQKCLNVHNIFIDIWWVMAAYYTVFSA